MKKILGILVTVAIFVGICALVTPAPASNCKPVCSSPEPGFECPTCQYWNPCSPNCGCKKIPGCKP